VKFYQFVVSLYPHMPTSFDRFILTFHKMAFLVSTSQIVLTSSLMMSGPIHSTSIHWIMRFRGNAGVLIRAAIEVKNISQV